MGSSIIDAVYEWQCTHDTRARAESQLWKLIFFFLHRFGTAGFCRTGNYGMPQYETNTMRICTRDAEGVQYDATVPVKPKWTTSSSSSNKESFSATEYCSESASDVPWSLDDMAVADPSMFSVGNMPMWSGEAWASQDRYPDNNRLRDIRNTNPGLRGGAGGGSGSSSTTTWTQSCEKSSPSASAGTAQLVCTTDADCVSLDASLAKLQCLAGVCVLDRQATGTCYSHRDCLASNKMCSGNGKCVPSILQVENDLDYAVDFELHAETCSASDESLHPTIQYDMYGASPWETIPDVLEMYGMCSYEDWYEYLEFIDPTKDSRTNLGLCGGQSEQRGCLPMASEATVSRLVCTHPFCVCICPYPTTMISNARPLCPG